MTTARRLAELAADRAATSRADRQLEALRTAMSRLVANPAYPMEARDAITLLVAVVGELHLQVDWLRRDLATLAIAPPAPPKSH